MTGNDVQSDFATPRECLVLGIDGGGTKTIAWLGRESNDGVERIGEGQAGSSNPQAVGFETAFDSIRQSVSSAFQQAGLARCQVAAACLCLAGTGRESEQEIVLNWLQENDLAQSVRLVSEGEALVAAVLDARQPNCADVALICGTGSLAWGRSSNEAQTARSGGWGYLLGDQGSGYWLGQQVLQFACKVADGREQQTDILSSVLNELQLPSVDQLVGWCYQRPNQRQRIASLAKLAFRDLSPAMNSESVIEKLSINPFKAMLENGADELADLVVSVVKQLRPQRYRLVLGGSVLANQAGYRQLVEQQLDQRGFSPLSLHVVRYPVSGVLNLAFELSRMPN